MEDSKYIKVKNGELWLTENELENLKLSYRIKDIIYAEQSPFQHVMIVDTFDFGKMLVLNGAVQTTSVDGYIFNEMISHIPLNFHPEPKQILIIGGGDLGVAREVIKYPQVESIDLVEIDELVVKVCKSDLQEVSGNLSDSRINFIFQDGVEFVKQHKNHYDVIIVDSFDSNDSSKNLFELSFYRNIHQALKDDGIMVCQSGSPFFHLNILQQTYDHVSSLFPFTYLYTATIPTYPGGLLSLTIGSKKYSTVMNPEQFNKNARYVNEDVLKSTFHLPQFIKDKLNY